jgi:hypothetical protein
VKEAYGTKFWDRLIQEEGRNEIETETGWLLRLRSVEVWMKTVV